MKFLEWNNIISQHIFNADNAGKNVHLYLTKRDILHLASNHFDGETEEEIWDNYITKIKLGLPGSIPCSNIIDKANHANNVWTKNGLKSIDGVELNYPPYINYLVFLILPLIESQDKYNPNNYYDRLHDFLLKNGINQNLRNRLKDIEKLWAGLANWSNTLNNGDRGFFYLHNFINPNWIYVGKVFSQCIFPPKAVKKLPELFLRAGMIPDSNYSLAEIKKYLLQYGSSTLFLTNSVIEVIKSDTNELGHSIIDLANREYRKWTGESHSYDENSSGIKRNNIFARIYLQFQLFTNEGRIEFSFRMKSMNEFPEDLCFNGNDILQEKGGYSNSMNLPFRATFQLRDDFNKWVAIFPDKNIRLFISAGSIQLSTDYWIETDTIIKTNWMYILCKNTLSDKISKWGLSCCLRFENESDNENMPEGYSLFRFLDPKEGLDEIPELTLIGEKSVTLVSALRFDFRSFTDDFLPEITITNSDGTEKVYLQYKYSSEKLFLKKNSNNNWLLPEDVLLSNDFNIRAEEEIFVGNETNYKIVSSNDSAFLLDESKLPKRDSFGRITNDTSCQYSLGSNTIGSSLQKQIPYQQFFRGRNEDILSNILNPEYLNVKGNILLSYLTLKGTTTAQDFYDTFELIFSKYFEDENQNNTLSYSIIKKASLNFFDYLGYLDYEYETKSIVVNPPQLIFIPTNKGRKVLLIGGRDNSLVKRIIANAPKHRLQVEIIEQFESNKKLLLPDAITIKSFGTSKENFGENNLIAFAAELKIKFNPSELVQVGLQHFSSSIQKYENYILANEETNTTFEDWARYIFNPETLHLDKSFSESFDKTITLLEYKLRPWEFYHRIWINEKCYSVDKNWGKYIVLKHHQKHVILYDRIKEKVAIPLDLHLPRLLAESIMLLSGLAPVYKKIEGTAFRIYENIPSVFIKNMFDKLGQKTIEFNF